MRCPKTAGRERTWIQGNGRDSLRWRWSTADEPVFRASDSQGDVAVLTSATVCTHSTVLVHERSKRREMLGARPVAGILVTRSGDDLQRLLRQLTVASGAAARRARTTRRGPGPSSARSSEMRSTTAPSRPPAEIAAPSILPRNTGNGDPTRARSAGLGGRARSRHRPCQITLSHTSETPSGASSPFSDRSSAVAPPLRAHGAAALRRLRSRRSSTPTLSYSSLAEPL